MNFLLIRHADAVPLNEAGVEEDEQRPLSAKGNAQCRLLAQALHKLAFPLGIVISSPVLRARQTAEGLLEHWPGEKPESEHVRGTGTPERNGEEIEKLLFPLEVPNVALIGHMPDLALLTGWLIGDKKVQIEIAKGGAVFLMSDTGPAKGGAVLTWLVTPEWCGAAGC